MQFDRVVNGVVKYIEAEVYPGMADWQEIFARIAVSRFVGNREKLKEALKNNAYVKAFNIMNEQGEVDIESFITDLKTQISAKGKVELRIPMFGVFCFTAGDVGKLHRYIMEV